MLMITNRTPPNKILYFFLILFIIFIGWFIFWSTNTFSKHSQGGIDFYTPWSVTRLFVLEGRSPYSIDVSLENESNLFGNLSDKAGGNFRFLSPLYSTLFYFPFSLIKEYTFALTLWMAFLEICMIVLSIVSIRLMRWEIGYWLLPIFLLFSLFWFHGLIGIINGNESVILTLFIFIMFGAIREKNDMSAGLFMALATIKPKLTLLLIIYVLVWSVSHRRWGLIRWFFVWLLILIGMGMFFITNWPWQFLRTLFQNLSYASLRPVGAIFQTWWPGVGTQLMWGFSIVILALLIVEWWIARGTDFGHFLWAACLTMTISVGIGFIINQGDFILLFIPLTLIFSMVKERWKTGGNWIVFALMIVIFIGLWALGLPSFLQENGASPSLELFLPTPFFILAGLYWIRWWALWPTRKLESLTEKS